MKESRDAGRGESVFCEVAVILTVSTVAPITKPTDPIMRRSTRGAFMEIIDGSSLAGRTTSTYAEHDDGTEEALVRNRARKKS